MNDARTKSLLALFWISPGMDVAEEGRRLCSKLSRLDFKLYTSHFGSCTTSVSKVTGFSLGSYFVEQRTSLSTCG
jgi:hypothetical protein